MNDALCRGAWVKGCTDIIYMTIEYPNYPIISLLTQPRGNYVNMLWLRNSSFHFGIWIRILTTATHCVTIELRHAPLNLKSVIKSNRPLKSNFIYCDTSIKVNLSLMLNLNVSTTSRIRRFMNRMNLPSSLTNIVLPIQDDDHSRHGLAVHERQGKCSNGFMKFDHNRGFPVFCPLKPFPPPLFIKINIRECWGIIDSFFSPCRRL